MKRSLTARLVALFALASLATVALIGTAMYEALELDLGRYQNEQLATHLQNIQYSVERVDTLERWGRVQARMDTLTPRDDSVRFWVLSEDAQFRYGKDLPLMERTVLGPDGRGSVLIPGHAMPMRLVSSLIPPLQDRPTVRLLVGIDAEPVAQTLRNFLRALTLFSLGAAVLVTLAGFWMARLGLQPLQRLSREARALGPTARGQRLPLERLPVELSALAQAVNGALDRLDAAYRQLETFNADVAHELRTPLANLIGGTQVALARRRGAPELEEVLRSNLEELESLRSIVNDMLFLARADQGEAATGLALASIAGEVEKTVEFFEFVLDEQGITVSTGGDTGALAPLEPALFRRAMSNLLQNAIAHSSPGRDIVVRIDDRDDLVWVRVRNQGAEIAPEALPRLFDRFFRVDAARHDGAQPRGHGLGLAIVKAVATMHGGGVSAASQGGTTEIAFSVCRPRS